MKKKRYEVLDVLRGIVLISMILYHGAWDLVHIFGIRWSWYRSWPGQLWQQSICWSFILLSGFCWSIGKRRLRRGLQVFGGGILVSLVTVLFVPKNGVLFGVLTFLGVAMILMIPLDFWLQKCRPVWGMALSLILFGVFRGINEGYLGWTGRPLVHLPDSWYANLFTAFLGMPESNFSSTDYFSIFPWFFLFLTGYFLHRMMAEHKWLERLGNLKISGTSWLRWLGKHSLQMYLLHQPVIYGVLTGIYQLRQN